LALGSDNRHSHWEQQVFRCPWFSAERRHAVGSFSIFREESDSMFDQLFFRSDKLTRQLAAPLVT
jgi:hypothetical protein